ncbi:MAG: amidohydrolase family protein [Deltaproteobacteria bacterium]|nr:amidohydrolase family protein [Deltaproteobacteria bacterium]
MSLVLFRDTRCLDAQVDVLWDDDCGITAVGPPGTLSGDEIVEGGLVTPPFAEPHVHLDAALLGARAPNRSGTLREGIANWARLREGLSRDDVIDRARATLAMYREHGCLRVRTHVDTGSLLAVEALLSLRDDNLQVVAFPQEGILRAPGRREAWERAVEMGCDAVGAIPHFERTAEEGWESVRIAFRLAEKHGLRVDLHCDETDDPGSRNLEVACAEAMRETVPHVVAGHCTAMHSYPEPYAAKVIELVASSGVQVVCNPLDNVVLQGRYDGYPRRRGLARVDQLWAQGASVGIGHDSVQDPWYRLGTASLLDAAYMLVHVGHLTSEADMKRAVRTLHAENHDCFGSRPEIAPGARGMLWWNAADEVELLRTRGKPRLMVH